MQKSFVSIQKAWRAFGVALCFLISCAHSTMADDTGLVAHYSFTEGQGSSTVDISPRHNSGTLHGGHWIKQGKSAALHLDGANDYVDAGADTSLKISGALTISLWMYAEGASSDAGIAGTGIESYQITHHNGHTLYCYLGGGNSVSAPLGIKSAHHIAFTWDGTINANGMKLYVDGLLQAEKASSRSSITNWGNFLIGKASTNFKGILDEVRVYNRELSAAELKASMQQDIAAGTLLAVRYRQEMQREESYMKSNLALSSNGAYALASSVHDLGPSYSDNLLDGNLDTAWQSLDADTPQWLEVHWEYPLEINRVLLAESGDSKISDLALYQWHNEAWKLIKRITPVIRNESGDIQIDFPTLVTDRLRVQIIKNSGPYSQLSEIGVYGPKQPLLIQKLEPTWRASHIWSNEPDQDVKTQPRWFRKSFQIRDFKGLKNAFILARSNDYYQISLNGHQIAEGSQKIVPVEITKYLKAGANQLAVRCDVRRSPGWPWMSLILEAIINGAKGTQYVTTDETWKVARVEQPGWKDPNFEDSSWEPVMVIGKVPISPWGNIEYFNLGEKEPVIVESITVQPPHARVGDDVEVSIRLRPRNNLTQPFVFKMNIGESTLNPTSANYEWAKAIIQSDGRNTPWLAGQTRTIKTRFRVPSYAVAGDSPMRLRGLGTQGNSTLQFLNAQGRDMGEVIGKINVTRPNMPAFKPTESFRLIKENGVSKFVIDGQKQVPLLWALGNVSLPRYQAFSTTGIHLYHLQVYPFRIEANDVYDKIHFPNIDKHIRHLLRIDPTAHFLVEMDLRENGAWDLRNRDELIETAFGKKESASFASTKYANDVKDYVRRLCRFLESKPYASHVLGYIPEIAEPESFMGGTSDNAFQMDRSKITIGDWSKQGIDYFRSFLRTKYNNDVSLLRTAWNDPAVTFESARPVQSQLAQEGYKSGLFRDPTKGRMAFDLFECNTTMVPRFLIENVSKVIKAETKGRALVCTYYGYTLEHLRSTNNPGSIQQGLHSYLYKMLDTSDIDCFMSPLQYDYSRFAGQKFTPFQPYASLRLHNKLYIAEMDYRTYISYLRAYGRHKSAKETEAVLKRDLGTTILQGSGAWFADWSPGSWGRSSVSHFDQPDILQTIKTMKNIYQKTRDLPRKSATEIAVIMSDKTVYYHDTYYATALYRNLIDRMLMEELPQVGAPYDIYDINDLGHDFVQKQYKLYIFLNPYFMTEKERGWAEALKHKGKTLLWLYAPGYVSDQAGLRLSAVEKLTDMKMGIGYDKERLRMTTTAAAHAILKDVKAESEMAMEEFSGEEATKKLHPIEMSPRFWVEDDTVTALAKYPDGKVALAAKQFGDHKSIYSGVPFLSRQVLRNVAVYAGVNLYAPLNVVVEADQNFLLLHNGFTGRKKFVAKLPRAAAVEDLFTGKTIATGKSRFDIDLPECSTQFYLLSK